MAKYKLIKTYPGSPDFGTIVENQNSLTGYYFKRGNNTILVLKEHVEGNPDYWEKVNDNLWYVVSKRDYQESNILFQEWFIYTIETCLPNNNGVLNYFKTKEEADEFILYNKPCLSYSDIAGILSSNQRDVVIKTIKSKL